MKSICWTWCQGESDDQSRNPQLNEAANILRDVLLQKIESLMGKEVFPQGKPNLFEKTRFANSFLKKIATVQAIAYYDMEAGNVPVIRLVRVISLGLHGLHPEYTHNNLQFASMISTLIKGESSIYISGIRTSFFGGSIKVDFSAIKHLFLENIIFLHTQEKSANTLQNIRKIVQKQRALLTFGIRCFRENRTPRTVWMDDTDAFRKFLNSVLSGEIFHEIARKKLQTLVVANAGVTINRLVEARKIGGPTSWFPKLVAISLAENMGLGDGGAGVLASLITTPSRAMPVRFLQLQGCGLTGADQGGQFLVDSLFLPGIEAIDISFNPIQKAVWRKIGEVLSQRNYSWLHTLDVANTGMAPSDLAAVLGEGVVGNKPTFGRLRVLSCGTPPITDMESFTSETRRWLSLAGSPHAQRQDRRRRDPL